MRGILKWCGTGRVIQSQNSILVIIVDRMLVQVLEYVYRQKDGFILVTKANIVEGVEALTSLTDSEVRVLILGDESGSLLWLMIVYSVFFIRDSAILSVICSLTHT